LDILLNNASLSRLNPTLQCGGKNMIHEAESIHLHISTAHPAHDASFSSCATQHGSTRFSVAPTTLRLSGTTGGFHHAPNQGHANRNPACLRDAATEKNNKQAAASRFSPLRLVQRWFVPGSNATLFFATAGMLVETTKCLFMR
jgi:hypothetical protein